MKRKNASAFLLIIILSATMLLSGCGGKTSNSTGVAKSAASVSASMVVSAATPVVTPTGISAVMPGSPLVSATPQSTGKKLNIVFVGNSYTYVPEIPDIFESFGNVSVRSFTMGGAKLSDLAPIVESFKDEDVVKNADIVVLQEWAAGLPLDGDTSVDQIINAFGKDKKYYYYCAFMNDATAETIAADRDFLDKRNIELIPTWFYNEYDGPFLQMPVNFCLPNDYHPNPFYGYAVASTLYCMLFDKKCKDLPYDMIISRWLADKTNDEKVEIIQGIQDACQKTLDKYNSK